MIVAWQSIARDGPREGARPFRDGLISFHGSSAYPQRMCLPQIRWINDNATPSDRTLTGRAFFLRLSQAMNCLATFTRSLRDVVLVPRPR